MKRLYLGLFTILLAAFVLSACSAQNNTATEKEETNQNATTTDETTSQNSSASGPTNEGNVPNAEALFVYGDVVASGACVLQNRFTIGDTIVFRMNVQDALTGEQPEDAKVVVHLSTGDELEMHIGSHPPDQESAPKFWTVAYTVPENAQTGTLEYYVTAETAEKSGEFRPFNVMPSLLTIVPKEEAVQAQAPAEPKAE